jgi:N-acetylglucosaminyldiphosphoundecaprenol N-acetyl-beta-D-mannosaminyltransferase
MTLNWREARIRSDGVARRRMFGVRFSDWSLDRVVETVASEPVPKGTGLRLVVTANLDHIVQLGHNASFRQSYLDSWAALVDGAPVMAYARLRGLAVPERVTGSDLFPALLDRLRPGRHRLALLCANATTARALSDRLAGLGFTDHLVFVAPPDFETNDKFGPWLIETLKAQRTSHLFFGIGAPKSEVWMHRHRQELPDCYGFGFGAALDYYAGTRRRAPRFMQRAGLEWLWRVASEPRRLARRYFVTSWWFLAAVFRDLANGGNPVEP